MVATYNFGLVYSEVLGNRSVQNFRWGRGSISSPQSNFHCFSLT